MPPLLSNSNLVARHFSCGLGGLPGEKYQVQYTTNFLDGWHFLTNLIAPSNGVVSFFHSGALSNRHLYYRIQQVP